jgi:branched-subunit amino acid ABC-type transport system permease component
VDLVVVVLLQVLASVASLALISVGLAVIFGMMRVINLAHGELIMLGGYAVIYATRWGFNLWVAMLIVAPLFVGVIGMIVERVVIRFLYGRMIDTMLATWGLSLLLIGAATMIFGNTTTGVSAPLGGITIGQYQTSLYELVLVVIVAAVVLGLMAVLKFTKAGLIPRATMQNPAMAASLGINTSTVYSVTFGAGAALSGMAGALIAPLSGVLPTMGISYVAKAFITVISGGAAIIAGTLSASTLLGSLNTLATFVATPVVGEVALLFAAIVLLRILPQGITGKYFRRAL